MNRRIVLFGALASAIASRGGRVQAAPVIVAQRVKRVEDKIASRRAGNAAVPGKWVAAALGEGLSPREQRIAAFRLVQNVPYKLTAWKGDPNSLFTLGRGDCRHKSAALRLLLRTWQFEARAVQVPFDWADLPIPSGVLSPLLETRGIHDSVEVKINNRFVLVDATWDPALAVAGFPVLANWDGSQPTLPITKNASVIVSPGDLKAGTNLYEYFGIKWPQRDRTLAFNRAFNAWTDDVRARLQSAKG